LGGISLWINRWTAWKRSSQACAPFGWPLPAYPSRDRLGQTFFAVSAPRGTCGCARKNLLNACAPEVRGGLPDSGDQELLLASRGRSARYSARLITVAQSTPSSRAMAATLFVGSAHSSTSRYICSVGHFRSPLDIRASHGKDPASEGRKPCRGGFAGSVLFQGGKPHANGIPIGSPSA
jgi:hypothetical protein